jgi:para-aminobenzoate synthetase component 1
MPNGEITAVSAIELDEPCSPCAAYERMRSGAYPWMLESALVREDIGRYSMVGCDPYAVASVRSGACALDEIRSVRRLDDFVETEGDAFAWLRSLMPRRPAEVPAHVADLPFLGGAVGYLGYELGAESVSRERDGLPLPDLVFLLVDAALVFDHVLRRVWSVGLGFGGSATEAEVNAARASVSLAARATRLEVEARGDAGVHAWRAPFRTLPDETTLQTEAAAYAKSISELLGEIERGNVYQVNLTQRLDTPYRGDPWQLYRVLRRGNPAPFAACIELPDVAILSSSPERFLRVDGDRRAQSRPIKGTRPRGQSARDDAALSDDLARSTKDRAENLMIADLVRNDLGQVCELGSVVVPSLMAIEPYASVWQMVTTVEGELARDQDALDALRACFPPGSMTGAPKIAAMRYIERLEPVRRGIYSGALGYLDVRGGVDTSVVIRSIFVRHGQAHLHVGGGVVADSTAKGEYRESFDKATALLDALERSRRLE